MKSVLFLLLTSLASAQFYNISTIAGRGRPTFQGSGDAALNALLIQPAGVAADAAGNVYVSDGYYHQVFKISAAGIITVFAGNGLPGFGGDGGPATSAMLFNPQDLAVDTGGNLYVCDTSNARVRKVTPAGIISTAVSLPGPHGVDVDAEGNLYIGQPMRHTVSKVTPDGVVTTIAGNGVSGFSGDGGPATSAMLSHPQGVRMDKNGNLFVADNYNHRIRKISSQGIITTIAGNGLNNPLGDGGLATSATLFYPTDIAIDPNGIVFIADATHTRIRRVDTSGFISTFAGGGASLQNGPASGAYLAVPTAIAIDGQGNLIVPLPYIRQVRRVTPAQTIATIAGASTASGQGDGGPASSASLLDPFGIAADSSGNLYVSDQADNRVRKISSERIISSAGGNGQFGSAGDRGQAVSAQIGYPRAVGLDGAGNLYITSPVGAVVRRITPTGTITTYAGGSGIGFAGDGAPAANAELNVPLGVTGDAQGNVYIADAGNARIRRIDASGIISTIAGTGVEGFSGDNGPALAARINQPHQIAVDKNGNIFFTDQGNHRIRKIAPGNIISTVAGNGTTGTGGDGGPATAAQLGSPTGITVDANGSLYITTLGRIRKVDGVTGSINTIAGGTAGNGFSGDGGLATLATMNGPHHLAVDASGNVYITDQDNQRVRQLTPVQIVREGVANGATLAAGGVAPGEIVTIYIGPGITLGPAAGLGLQIDSFGRVGTILGGIQALFDGAPAPITYVNATQINVIVPYAVSGKATTQLQLMIQGKPTNTVTVPVVPSSPGVFAITNADGSVNTTGNPTPSNGALVIYATGEGDTVPAVPNGTVNNSVFPKPVLPVTAQIGGQEATVLYAGAAPGFVAGVLQINLQIPPGVSGTVPLVIKIGAASTPPGLQVSVRPQ